MAVTYYLLLQDRIDEAQKFFGQVDPRADGDPAAIRLFQAYLDFYTPEHKLARRIAEAYREYPVDRWRNVFAAVLTPARRARRQGRRRWSTRKTASSSRRGWRPPKPRSSSPWSRARSP